MADLLQEFCDSRGVALRVDRAAGVIRGVKILGPHSRNGRQYLAEALARAVALYEGAKVNVNHPKGNPLAPRDYQERLGVIRNVEHRSEQGLFADFHFNPKHQLAEQLIWDAENAPENVGFSHNVQAQTACRDETLVVEDIVRVQSVDLVADPATTRGLFEEVEPTSVDRQMLEQRIREQDAEIVKLRAEVVRLQLVEAASGRASAQRPLSRDQASFHAPSIASAKEFARTIKK